ncbi:hypothetical protein N7444_001430 [Penicillium canescens]|nr:hypothetical protein N7444_001430 [Penicillium canescens]
MSIGFISSSFARALCWDGLLQPEPEVEASKPHIQDAIRHCQPTLEIFVYRERQLAPIDADVLFEDDRDVSPAPSAAHLCLRPTAKHSQLQILHLRVRSLNRIHRDIAREITIFLHDTRKGYSRHPRSCWGSVNRNASNDNHQYGPIFDEYFYRSQFEYIDPQQGVLASFAAIADAESLISFAEWAFSPTDCWLCRSSRLGPPCQLLQ